MSYMMTGASHTHPKPYPVANVAAFAVDLAVAIDTELSKSFDGAMRSPYEIRENDHTGDRIIVFKDSVMAFRVSCNEWNEKEAARFVISGTVRPGAVDQGDIPFWPNEGKQYRLPSITVSADRSAESVARDVKRKICDVASDPMAAILEYAGNRQRGRATLDETIARLSAMFPEIRFDKAKRTAEFIPFSWYPKDAGHADYFYMMGRVYPDGTVHLDRTQGLAPSLFVGFAKAIQTWEATKRAGAK
jgi:hypothetical protein